FFSCSLLRCEMIVGNANNLHRRPEIVFVARDEGDVSFFRGPTMRTRLAFCENSFLIAFGQSNVAMTRAMDVHKHCRPNKEGVFVNAGVLFLGHVGQTENSLAKFLMKILFRFHAAFRCLLRSQSMSE